ncbi:hypothetical protein ISN45_At02g005480, partial [Arabidopsis thaliana x Arabidopsis arenosa]
GLGLGLLGNVDLWPTKNVLFGENTYEALLHYL